MALLDASAQKQLRDVLTALPRPVTLVVFTTSHERGNGCDACEDTRDLVEELASIADGKVRVNVRDLATDHDEAELYGVDKVPAVVVLGGESGRRDFGIRFFGTPAGYEFVTLIEDIKMVSTGSMALADRTVDELSHLTSPLHIQVFVTPTCPYCPRAVLLAHRLAMASDWIRSDAVDAAEFPELAQRYQVYGVPRTVINETVHVEGAVPERMLMAHLVSLLEGDAPTAA